MTKTDATLALDAPATTLPATQGDGPQAILNLMAQAIQKGMAVDTMESLQTMFHKEQDRDAARQFADAMAAFQAECPPIQKRKSSVRTGQQSGGRFAFTYAGLDDIEADAGPVARRHGLSWTWDSDIRDGLMHVTCTILHRAGHSRTARFANPMSSSLPVNEQQKYAAALTYARRQSLIQALGITTADEDVEGAAEEVEAIGPQQEALLAALLDEVGADRAKFLKWLGVDSLSSLPSKDYQRAINALENKRKKA